MTFDDWINNPAGGKSSFMTNRQMYRDMYTAKYNKIMLREGNKFTFHTYKNKAGTHFIVHIKVPSEVVPKFYYDVVVSFTADNPAAFTTTTLKGYNVQFYTNSPDFVYTHCHAYKNADLFFGDLSNRMNKLSLTKVAVERNPQDVVGYVKSIYFAYLIIKSNNLFDKIHYTELYSEKDLQRVVRHANDVVEERQLEEAKLKAEAKRKASLEKYKEEQDRRQSLSHKGEKQFSNTIKRTPTVGSRNVAMTKRTKTTKRT